MKKISVIIPTHNRCDVLPRAIKSVQAQTRSVNEIVIVSDGSTDETDFIVEKMSKEDPRIRYISYYPGHNGNYARNEGIKNSTGEYIAFLDDDDEWLPQKIEKQMQVFENDETVGLVYTGQNCLFTDIGVSYKTKPSWGGDLSKRIFIHSDPGTTSQVMVKRSVLDITGLFDLNLEAMQDYDLWIRCCLNTRVGYVYEPCINYYNKVGTNQVSSNTEKYIRSVDYILNKYADEINKFDKKYQKDIFCAKKLSIARRCLRNSEKKSARNYIKAAWKIHPSKTCIALYFASWFSYKHVLMIRSRFKY